MRFLGLGLSAVLIALSVEAASLQNEQLTLEGRVLTTRTRTPIPNARVTLRSGLVLLALPSEDDITTISDTQGRFSFVGLDSGRYGLMASLPDDSGNGRIRTIELVADRPLPEVELWVTRSVEVSGRVLDIEGNPIPGVRVDLRDPRWINGEWRLMDPSQRDMGITDEDGAYSLSATPGEYYLRVSFAPTSEALPDFPYYYPGVADVDQALPVRIAEGVDFRAADITIRPTEVYRIGFEFAAPSVVPGTSEAFPLIEGQFPLAFAVRPRYRNSVQVNGFRVSLQALDDDRWLTESLPVGDYDVYAMYDSGLQSQFREVAWGRLNPISVAQVTLDDRDADLGVLTPGDRAPVSGQIRLPDSRPAGFDVTSITGLSFGLLAPGVSLDGTRRIMPDANGTFRLDLFPGLFLFLPPALLPANGLPEGWYVAAVRSGGRDVLKEGLLVTDGLRNPVEIVLADGAARIRGVVRSNSGQLVPGGDVVLIPSVQRRGSLTRFPGAIADVSGRYSLTGVPPGDYVFVAIDSAGVTDFDTCSPEFVRSWESRGQRITVDAGADMEIDGVSMPLFEP